jgi:hypothetical protein
MSFDFIRNRWLRKSSLMIAGFNPYHRQRAEQPELTCQHLAALSPGEEAIFETKILLVRGPTDYVFKMAAQQRESLE